MVREPRITPSGPGKKKRHRHINRRRFIKDVSAGAAGIALASTFPGLARSQLQGPKNSKVVILSLIHI